MSRRTTNVWVVNADEGSCTHPSETLHHVGDDGVNAYYQCARCESVLISRIDELLCDG